ncbi:hypothetical protein IWQ60_007459 [Tieghemiomyces parasiticus]|uniref:MOSC domain-containing protein n=1 Tax=Tieghemiomyces parasiticus TaxID=78921 RepID=A0A9W7ZXB0_9FUNG|nr:hypothetical protein IWQ60_007459 [Tieghemiomyces parasiticus]
MAQPTHTQTTETGFQSLWRDHYQAKVESIVADDFPQLAEQTYLDHAGTTLPSRTAIQNFAADITSTLYANPHSQHPAALATADAVQAVRTRILASCNVTELEYSVVFTANATAALKLAAEIVPWQAPGDAVDGSHFWYLEDAHVSLLGMRELAAAFGAQVRCLTAAEAHQLAGPTPAPIATRAPRERPFHVVAYPVQCNFSGARYPVEWTSRFKDSSASWADGTPRPPGTWLTLLDAASYLTTSQLDLGALDGAVDLVALSFYKIFGFPTGLGALLIRNDLAPHLCKRYFGGGTVLAATAREPWQVYRPALSDKFEDGTINFADIVALGHAYRQWDKLFISMPTITRHTAALTLYAAYSMTRLSHANGRPLCMLYLDPELGRHLEEAHETDLPTLLPLWTARQGPILNLSLRREDGMWIGYAEVSRLAGLNGINLRAGGACNPGALHRWLGLKPSDVRRNLKPHDMQQNCRLSALAIYPIKSCHAMAINAGKSWPLAEHGLLYDREWSLIDARTGRALNQKRYPRMCLIRPVVDRHQQTLAVTAPGHPDLRIRLTGVEKGREPLDCRICGDNVLARRYAPPHIDSWFSSVLGFPCHLVRQDTPTRRTDSSTIPTAPGSALLFANDSPFLVVSEASTTETARWIAERAAGGSMETIGSRAKPLTAARFRSNLVVGGAGLAPFEEDRWTGLQVGGQFFEVSSATIDEGNRSRMAIH